MMMNYFDLQRILYGGKNRIFGIDSSRYFGIDSRFHGNDKKKAGMTKRKMDDIVEVVLNLLDSRFRGNDKGKAGNDK